MIGLVIGRFVVVRKLGQGGMGAVYVAQHTASSSVRCVIKVMLEEFNRQPLAIARFENETRAVAQLKHDNIVQLEDFGVLPNGRLFQQFELIEGAPLDQIRMRSGGRLSLRVTLYVIFQLCDAMDHAHRAGVIHRDLKPDNLLLEEDPEARIPWLLKVVDFGISKVARGGEGRTFSGMSMGTPRYMSVEQYRDAGSATPKSDVYSTAIITYELLTGDLPWGRPDTHVLYHLQSTQPPARPSERLVPPSVWTVLRRCLSTEPGDRPTMQELAVALASAVEATDREPSGTSILRDIARKWVVSSPADLQTVRKPGGVETHAAQLWPQIEIGAAVRRAREAASELPASTCALPLSAPTSGLSSPVAESRVSDADHVQGVVRATGSSPGAFAARSPLHVPAVVRTGITTSVPAHDSAGERPRSIVRVSEVTLTGTARPDSIEHADLPLVVVAPDLAKEASITRAERAAASKKSTESPPMIILPGQASPARSRASTRIAAALAVCACAVGAVIVSSSLRSSDTTQPTATNHSPPASAVSPASPAITKAVKAVEHDVAETQRPAAAPKPPAPAAAETSKRATAVSAKPAPRGNGVLAISVTPWASFTLNGKEYQDGTPFREMVPSGRYRVRLFNEDLNKSEHVTVNVEPGKTTVIERKWR